MFIETGQIKITEEIDYYDGELLFFKFKQNKHEYYCISVKLLDEREGFLVFALLPSLSSLLKKSDYHVDSIFALFKEKVEEFYFVAFEGEDAYSENIEYCGPIEKKEVLKLYNIE